jgi:hypothetical protein
LWEKFGRCLTLVLRQWQAEQMKNRTKAKTQFALIEFDPARVAKLNMQAEAGVFAHIIRSGLLGLDYPVERGIVQITPCDAPLVFPQAGIDGEMTVSAD